MVISTTKLHNIQDLPSCFVKLIPELSFDYEVRFVRITDATQQMGECEFAHDRSNQGTIYIGFCLKESELDSEDIELLATIAHEIFQAYDDTLGLSTKNHNVEVILVIYSAILKQARMILDTFKNGNYIDLFIN